MINMIKELVCGDYRRTAGMVLQSIDTSAKGGQYHNPFYSRQIIKGMVNLLVVVATIEGLLVLSSLTVQMETLCTRFFADISMNIGHINMESSGECLGSKN